MTMTMSPGYLLEWSRYIVEECDTRNSRTIQSGELLILTFFRYIFLLKLVLDDPLFCRFVSVTFVVIEFSELARKLDDRLGKRRTRKYSSRNVFHRRMLGLHPEFPSFVAGPKHGLGTFFFGKVMWLWRHTVLGNSYGTSDGHWYRDVTYRVHMGLPVFVWANGAPRESGGRVSSSSCCGFGRVLEDLVPKHSQVKCRVPFMSTVFDPLWLAARLSTKTCLCLR